MNFALLLVGDLVPSAEFVSAVIKGRIGAGFLSECGGSGRNLTRLQRDALKSAVYVRLPCLPVSARLAPRQIPIQISQNTALTHQQPAKSSPSIGAPPPHTQTPGILADRATRFSDKHIPPPSPGKPLLHLRASGCSFPLRPRPSPPSPSSPISHHVCRLHLTGTDQAPAPRPPLLSLRLRAASSSPGGRSRGGNGPARAEAAADAHAEGGREGGGAGGHRRRAGRGVPGPDLRHQDNP
jgi:hypothetical protein